MSQKMIDNADNRWKSFAVLGMTEVGNGTVSILTDSSCLDPLVSVKDCLWVLGDFLSFAVNRTTLQEDFKLPYDYDVHIEDQRFMLNVDEPDFDYERNKNLRCEYKRSPVIERYESQRHVRTNIKIRDWAPNAGIYDDIDVLTVVEIIISCVLLVIIAVFCCTTKKRLRRF